MRIMISKLSFERFGSKEIVMLWYHYVACFFAGVFLTNAIPHFVHGVSGDNFPTPFAKPPGKGLSSPRINVVWASLLWYI
jgi:hypothetical protein